MIAPCRNPAFIALLIALPFACCSCEPNKPVDSGVNYHPTPTGPSATGTPANDTPDIPKDAQYTIVCRTFQEESHVQDSRQAQQMLFSSTNMKKWYVVHAADHSTLYFGFYRNNDPRDPNDGPEGQRAINDLNTIRAMTDSQGNRPFSESLLVGIDAPDPEANPAWDITRTKGTWSVEIACFTGTADRKERAVQAVAEARKEGIEAYYYHGETASSVCLGCWPANAAIEVTVADTNTNPNAPVIITDKPMAPGIAGSFAKSGVQTAAYHVDVLDPTLTQALNKYPDHATNNETRMVTDATGHQKIVEKPFIFKIPHKDPMADNPDDHYRAPAAPAVAPPRAPVQDPDMGHLRSLGE
jgi:hypothetical protein